MKSYAKPQGGGAAARAARKKKTILIALAGITLLTWSRTMLGGDGKPEKPASAAPAGGAPAGAAVAASRPSAKSITSFEQARERMRTWPAALERRALESVIEDPTPAYWTTARAAADAEPETAQPAEAAAPAAAPPPSVRDEVRLPAELPARLRSTALLGAHRFAVIGNQRYAEGDLVEVPGVGRFLLETIRPREAVLRLGERTWTLRIADVAAPRDA